MFKVLVCGGRDFGDLRGNWWDEPSLTDRKKQYTFIHRTLSELTESEGWPISDEECRLPTWTLISGAARGADTAALDYAVVNWMLFEEYPADWETYGKKAGFIRNKKMLDEGKPNVVVAFPGGKGTAGMVTLAKKAGIKVLEVEYTPVDV